MSGVVAGSWKCTYRRFVSCVYRGDCLILGSVCRVLEVYVPLWYVVVMVL